MTIYDDAADAARNLNPLPCHCVRVVLVPKVTFEIDPSGTSQTLTVWVDLGSGPVKARAGQAVLAMVLATPDIGLIVNQLAIVLFENGSPIVVDFLGSVKLSYP